MKYVKPLNLFEEVKKLGGRMLSVDTGPKFSGVAIVGKGLHSATPYKIINMHWNKKPLKLGRYLSKMIVDWDVKGVSVGYSSMYDHSKEIDHCERVYDWINSVHDCPWLKYFPFTLIDERKSTKNAKGKLDAASHDPVTYERDLNKYAAVEFTQKWLDHMNHRGLYIENEEWIQGHLEDVGERWNSIHGGW